MWPALGLEDPAQVEVGEAVAFVPLGLERHPQPGDRLVRLELLNVVGANVVVGIPELGIQVDGPVAVLDGRGVVLLGTIDVEEVLQLAHTLTEKWTLSHRLKNHLAHLDEIEATDAILGVDDVIALL